MNVVHTTNQQHRLKLESVRSLYICYPKLFCASEAITSVREYRNNTNKTILPNEQGKKPENWLIN